ncbi:hypothetical protein Pmani_002657 [Petrolisthes manimaculis]|uniref:Uncharacterized protein n=1 Tax=Petrolisthes manimaculis TaxID=1843537 RepID=A0AAE1QK20_9EUCA|nr:hypothetical protein Pmani_002657 [Petrolisthes manimaculis]
MASIVTRAAPCLVRCCLVRPHVHTLTARTVISFQGATHPWTVASEEAEEIQEEFMNKHLESLSVWYSVAEKLSLSRISQPELTPEELQRNNAMYREQIVDLLDHMADEKVLDVCKGWMGTQ